MSSEKPNFLSQPVVKNIFMFRNGDPYYDARRIVINQKRVSNFETLLREVTGGIQAPFGAVRNIYTPRGGHKVDCLESLHSGEQYVAAGKERFKRLDYLHIGSRRKRMMKTLPMQAKPLPPNRIIVSARFLKPIKEPCTIFVVANGDVLNPAMRLLIHQRILDQFDRILELMTEKMGLKVLGGVRSLYTYEGHQVTDGNQLENGQLYVAVGRERFKKLPYSDLLFTKPRGTRRVNGMKAYSLPPIYRYSKQNGNSKSMVQRSESGDGDSKASPPVHNGNKKERLSFIVREISQARLLSLRTKRSGQSMTLGNSDNDDVDSKEDDGNTEDKTPQDQPAEEKPPDDETNAAEENGEKAGEEEEAAAENTTEEDTSASKEEKKENQETNDENDGEATAGSEEGEKDEQDTNIEEEKQDKDSGKGENSSDQVNDVDTGEEQKETESSDDPGNTQTTESGEEEVKVNGEVSGEDGEVEIEAELDLEEKHSASSKDATADGEKGEEDDEDNQDKSSYVED